MSAETPHRGTNLRGRSFVGEDHRSADSAGADLRAADFSGADLTRADFSNAELGMRPAVAAGLFVSALVVVAAAGWFTGWSLGDILDELQSSEWERVFGGSLAALVIMIFVLAAVLAGLRRAILVTTVVFGAALALRYVVLALGSGRVDPDREVRIIALLLLLGASMIAGGLARAIGGSVSPIAITIVAMTGGVAAGQAGGGVAGIVVSMLLVVLAKRTLRLDPRDRLAHDIVQGVVSRHSTKFVGANRTGADFTGTTIVRCDTTGVDLTGTIWDGGIGPWLTPEGDHE